MSFAIRCAIGAVGLGTLSTSALGVQLDITAIGSSGYINSARFEQYNFQASGTGVFKPIVRIEATGNATVEQGYNTSGRPVAFDEKTDLNHTHNALLGDFPIVNVLGTDYYEFIMDGQEGGGPNKYVSLDKVQIYTSPTGSQNTATVASLGALKYDLDAGADNLVKIDASLGSGNGETDMRMLVPVANFAGVPTSHYLYLYSRFGDTFAADSSFEEWSHQEAAPTIPLPPVASAGAVGLLALCARRRRA